ncbi:MAG TPA: hydrogenase maturation protease [Caldithrix abyssi]|uniref:Hydrogenase maturation protease n=1 Tax=Caldithrix abyssi TaxID=187145 RepID=A0A7V5H200_CALAY|nr:hydrogenase maturation protease [Caldithrix abyssi]
MNEQQENSLVLGLGNPLLGDDRIGLQLVEDLAKINSLAGLARFQCSVQAGLYLLDLLIGFQQVIFVDSLVHPQEEPGHVKCWQLPETASYIKGSSPHYIGVHSMLTIGKKLNLRLPEKLWLIGITIKDGLQISEHFSRSIRQKYPQILNQVQRQLEEILLRKRNKVKVKEPALPMNSFQN